MSHGRPGTRTRGTAQRQQRELEELMGVPLGKGLVLKRAWKQAGIHERAGLAPLYGWLKEEEIQTLGRQFFSAFGNVLSMLKKILFSQFPFPLASFTS